METAQNTADRQMETAPSPAGRQRQTAKAPPDDKADGTEPRRSPKGDGEERLRTTTATARSDGEERRKGLTRSAARPYAGSPVAMRSSKWAPVSETAAPGVGNWSMIWSSAYAFPGTLICLIVQPAASVHARAERMSL